MDPANADIPLDFDLELGTRVSAVVPQPISRNPGTGNLSQALDQIDVYFDSNELDIGLATDPSYYRLILTQDTVTNTDDAFFQPISANYIGAEQKVELQFASDLHDLAGGDGTFRLRVGTNETDPSSVPLTPITPGTEPGDSFSTALTLDPLSGRSQIIESVIANPAPFGVDFPGSGLEPGRAFGVAPDAVDGIEQISYSFPETYGEGFANLITEPQKQRAREAFEILSNVSGVDYIETDTLGIKIVTGDPALADGEIVLNNANNWNDEFLAASRPGEPSYFEFVFDAISQVGSAGFIPSGVGDSRFTAGDIETVFPSSQELINIQRGMRPDGLDVDMYRFEITGNVPGLFAAEIIAERLDPTSPGGASALDSVLRLYRETGTGTHELIAQNDDYFSEDSFLELALEPGTYFIGVSSTGNDSYDPSVTESGFGGTSQGAYELRLDFRPSITDSLRDASGVALDGDGDGTPGGVFNFWFRAASPAGTADRTNEVQQFDISGATDGVFRIIFDGEVTMPLPYDATPADVQAAMEALPNIGVGNVSVSGNVLPEGPVSIEFVGDLALTDVAEISIGRSGLTGGMTTITTLTQGSNTAQIVYVDKADTTPDDQPNVGTLANPYNVIHSALNLDADGLPLTGSAMDPNAAGPGDVVRIVANGDSPETSLPYQIGLSAFDSSPLEDGAKLDIPNDVSLVVDPGVVFKMRRSAIVVGSTSVGIDHSLASLQVLGTPQRRATFTSINDFTTTNSARGDWGGILFAGDQDQAAERVRYEELGIFLNYVGNADIRYGGGIVNIGSIPQSIVAVDIRDARPSIRFNNLTSNSVAAISATPDSFEETRFSTPEFQRTRFTSDYARIGAEIQSNTLSDNQLNGLLVQIDSAAGTELTRQTVVGRWNDRDIVHIVDEVLEIQGTPGGLIERPGEIAARLDASLRIDPGVVVKLDGGRIETGISAQLIAEGLDGQEIVFTSIHDDRFGGSGSFDSSNNGNVAATAGDWGGLYVGHSARASLDHVLVTMAGGISSIEGGSAGFNAVEIHQANARIANSTFVDNASGLVDLSAGNREGRGTNEPATIFVRGAQPILIGNSFSRAGAVAPGSALAADFATDLVPAISINANSLNRTYVSDLGRSTGASDRLEGVRGNQGPLVRHNRYEDNDINGMLIRGELLDTEGVWDDTDNVHVLFDSVDVGNFTTYGGLRLESSASESLVVKLGGDSKLAGFDATGSVGQITDRIGGSLNVVGQPGRPVILTSLSDNTVGAGMTLSGGFQNETLRPGFGEPQARTGAQIDFNFSAEVAANPILVAGFEQAARFWEEHLNDEISLTYDVVVVETGSEPFASASSESVIIDYDTVIQQMQADAEVDEIDLLSRLPMFSELTVQGPPGQFDVPNSLVVSYPNAKALGFAVPDVPSQITAGATRDGQINMTALYERSSSIDGFASVMIHEIGHTLGFQSSVPEDGAFGGGATLTTWDLFRLEPGAGAADFTNSPRMLDPVKEQVFYDGGLFDPVGIDIPGLTLGDIPVSRGTTFEDGSMHPDDGQPSHWRSLCAPGMNGIFLGVMDPGGSGTCPDNIPVTSGDTVTANDFRSLGLIGFDVGGFSISTEPTAGDWRGIQLDEYANDRNVELVVELEGSNTDAAGANRIPDRAEFVGLLAQSEFESDENLRVGFEVHGVLNSPGDIDVYSFEGVAGTEVWLDIDNTAASLDSVVELINANAVTLAQSDDSLTDLPISPGGVVAVGQLSKSGFYPTDHFSVNPNDAGMRLTLPGTTGETGTYFVRVRSSSDNLDDVNAGVTQGAYELNIRLREVDEVAGSGVKYADIRYAKNGIDASGLVAHSPLQTEFVEPGDISTVETALNVGNVFQTDRAEISISGTLEPIDDDVPGSGVDWYRFQLGSAVPGVVIDVDYADGASNPNTNIAVYRVGTSEFETDDENDDRLVYDLVYIGDGSNVTSDLLTGIGGGTFGSEDPFLGPVYPQFLGGDSTDEIDVRNGNEYDISWSNDYLLGIASEALRPEGFLDQIFIPNALDADTSSGGTEFETIAPIDLSMADRPFGLQDLSLYVATDGGTSLSVINPFTGAAIENPRGLQDDEGLGYMVGALGMRGDGSLFSLSLGTDAETSGNFLEVDWAQRIDDAGNFIATTVDNLRDDGIVGFNEVPPDDPMSGDPPSYEDFGDGIQFFGMTFTFDSVFAVGERGAKDDPELMGAEYTENVVYQLDGYPETIDGNDTEPGTAVLTEPVREDDPESATYFGTIPGALTNILEVGQFDTSGGGGGLIQGLAEQEGTLYGVGDDGWLYSTQPNVPGQGVATATTAIAQISPGGDFRGLSFGPANQNGDVLFAINGSGELFAFDTNGTPQQLFDGAASVMTDAMDAQGLSFSTLDQNLWLLEGNVPEPPPEGDPTPIIESALPVLTFTVPHLDEAERANTAAAFFSGNESTFEQFNEDFNFPGGAHGSFLVDVSDQLSGLNSRDEPMLHFDYVLRTENAGTNERCDDFRIYGECAAAEDPFDIVDELHRDSLRVFATSAENPAAGDWVLLATNNSAHLYDAETGLPDFDSRLTPNEFDNASPKALHLRELFDNSRLGGGADTDETQVRQGRVSLAGFAGAENVTLRFEFSTEGAVEGLAGDEFGNAMRTPLRLDGGRTDNQNPDGSSFLEVSIGNMAINAASRGEAVRRDVVTEADGSVLLPAFEEYPEADPTAITQGDYQIYIRPALHDAFNFFPPELDVNTFDVREDFSRTEHQDTTTGDGVGDVNRFREQGQLILHSNRIADSEEYGIRVTASPQIPAGAADLVIPNSARLVRGAVIENNLVWNSGIAGIHISGDEAGTGAVPYARLVNNTVVGDTAADATPTTIGIEVGANASPTLLNNIVAYTQESISVASSSTSTVIMGTLFHGNVSDPNQGQLPITSTVQAGPDGNDGLFRNPELGNFLLTDGALAIDSGVASQEDRPSITMVSGSLDLDFESTIIAPDRDLRGQLRIPGANPGESIIDRGAFERADNASPQSELINPADNASSDLDPNPNSVRAFQGPFNVFEIRLFDIDISGNDLNGVGIDDSTIVAEAVTIRRGTDELVEGQDYVFSYDSTSDIIRLLPVAGVWTNGAYEIEFDNMMMTDLAANPLAANQMDGSTKFFINLINEPGPVGDYGDAPMPFPTFFADGGAVHVDTSTYFIGATVTTEMDGVPSENADADLDDGVVFLSDLIVNRSSQVTVNASTDGFLDAWIDFNGDGDWGDTGEQVFTSQALVAGDNTLDISTPNGSIDGTTFARFRFSSTGGLMPTGMAEDGEVEDYAVTIVDTGVDYGDAPDNYPTTGENAAGHAILPGFFLGEAIDAEPDGQPSVAADGDGFDEDGVSLPGSFVPSGTSEVEIVASAAGVLNAWIDFNADGDWNDPGEQVATDMAVIGGLNQLNVDVPADAVEGDTYARFRFSSVAGLGFDGLATDGEVEDYLVSVTTNTWHNSTNPTDVNNDGFTAPLDALQILTELDLRQFSDPVTGQLDTPANSPPFLDVDNDGFASPLDALLVINNLPSSADSSAVMAPRSAGVELGFDPAEDDIDDAFADWGAI
ncbi:MAG: NF038122 family metalloprotease [Planctomycetota bacterium]